MKRLLIISGSYREGGDIAYLTNRFIEGFKETRPAGEIELVHLRNIGMEYCRGCWTCADEENIRKTIGDCPIRDDVRVLLEKSAACDVLVYATPVYEMGPTALMKKFLERNLPVVGGIRLGFSGRIPRRKGKAGAVILSSGAPYPINVLLGFTRYPRKLLSLFCRFHGCGKTFVLPAGGVGANEKMRNRWGDRACRLGKKVAARCA